MELSELKGLGPTRIARLRAMGISSLRDLIFYLPSRYEDQLTVSPCSVSREGPLLVQGIVSEKPKISYYRGKSTVNALIRDESGSLALCWFNQPWMTLQLPVHTPILLYGRLTVKNQRRTLINPKIVKEPGWVPVYRISREIPSGLFRSLLREALEHVSECCPETLPESFRRANHLSPLSDALRQAHFPENMDRLREARRRLAFENMLLYLMCVSIQESRKAPGHAFPGVSAYTEDYWKSLRFAPTSAQRRVLDEIAADLQRNHAMSRLVQGDVGCGKTAIAFGAIFLAWKSHFQSAMMAPTEILARQHYENALKELEPLGLHCRLLTGNTRARERKNLLTELAEGKCDVLFGTHALISEDVHYRELGLVITDEQHRFGVRQRGSLRRKGKDSLSREPHVLVMSATPIPRTMALILYGDLDLSIVDELPPGRHSVKTRMVPLAKRKDMYQFLRGKIAEGRQAYIVCPLIEDSESLEEVQSAKTLYDTLKKGILSDVSMALTWGSQKSDEKAEILQSFAAGKISVMVSTTVIEVGINVPNATVMVIENASRFGLSQLHQLRGRVGRGTEESWCFLVSSETERLKTLCETNDGFVVAQKDLELRGPGELMGTRQSGEDLHGLPLNGDTRLLNEVAGVVHELLQRPEQDVERICIEKLAADFAQDHAFRIEKT